MTETATQTTETTELTKDQQLVQMRKLAEMKHKTLTQLINIHIDNFSAIMVNNNGVSYNHKIQAANALKEAFAFALDFGLNVSKAKIRQKGTNMAKEVNSLAGVLVQALDNRMLILADKMAQKEIDDAATEATNTEQPSEVVSESTEKTGE